MKRFRTKNDMWNHLADVMNGIFGSKKTHDRLSKRVQTILNQKKNAVNRNRKSGATRMDVAYEEEVDKIAAVDDSIEPEVLRGVKRVQYKVIDKKVGMPPNKTPRWDKPNKKGILNTLSQSMLSIEKRRVERDKSKEERRREMHEEIMELFRSARRNEN